METSHMETSQMIRNFHYSIINIFEYRAIYLFKANNKDTKKVENVFKTNNQDIRMVWMKLFWCLTYC